jgi:hypothetical protein
MTAFTRNLVALAAVTLSAGGCAYGSTMTDNSMTDEAMSDETMTDVALSDDRTVVRVTNNNWSDMTIYLLRSGARRRLGTVTSQSTHTFVVPTSMISLSSRVYLLADPIGSARTFTSAPLIINPGQTAEWKLENSLALSSVWIR